MNKLRYLVLLAVVMLMVGCSTENTMTEVAQSDGFVQEQTEDKMAQLRRLDAAVTQKATSVSLVFGVIGALILGMGMSLAMTDIGKIIGLLGGMAMLIGILIGIIGIVLVSVAYPIYNSIIKKEREKIAPEIISPRDIFKSLFSGLYFIVLCQ